MALGRMIIARRRFSTSLIRLGEHYPEGPGSNLPFKIQNKWRLLATMTLFFGSGLTAPFLLVRHQLKKK
ncbi:cytochrome c oxidase subunit 7C, mitochondrial-like [Saccoglossus kowalevskii]